MSTGWKILAADDDPTMGILLQAVFPAPHRLQYVADGLAALAAWEASPDFDVLLLDVEMPGLDGLSLAQELRRRHGEGLAIVLLTGREDAQFQACCRALSAVHLAKPVNWGELPAQIAAVLAGER
ncbi:response regulator [Azonexus sp.]|uniref:response regulator n=1 Tax=Azonexus sp. TaxID=1872668 RepID=UPI0039E50188